MRGCPSPASITFMVYFFMGGMGSNLDFSTLRSQSPRSASSFPANAAPTSAVRTKLATVKEIAVRFTVRMVSTAPSKKIDAPEACIGQSRIVKPSLSAMGEVAWRGLRQFGRTTSSGLQLVDRTPGLIDCLVRVGVPSRIGVGNGDAAAAPAGDFIGLGPFSFRIE